MRCRRIPDGAIEGIVAGETAVALRLAFVGELTLGRVDGLEDRSLAGTVLVDADDEIEFLLAGDRPSSGS